jgi:isopenicillin-N N-acyltransferase-like protein
MEVVVFDQVDPAARGEAHGEMWREEIAQLAEIRLGLTLVRGAFVDADQVLRVAAAHLEELARVDPELSAEFRGIARGADIDPTRLVVLNHYTDLRDVSPSVLGEASAGAGEDDGDPGGCTALYVNGSEGPILAQTWDMHGTAEPFVRLIRIAPAGTDQDVICFTLTGCVGMTGLARHGLAVTINNLTSTDAQVGMIWPCLVRRMLMQSDATTAREHLMKTRLSSGHHYMIADEQEFFGVETSGQEKVVTQLGPKTAHVHTNHCFDPVLRGVEKVSPLSTTYRRMELATTAYAQYRPETAEQLWEFLSSHEGHPRSICSHVDDETGDPSASRTCGLMLMRLRDRAVWAARGCPHENERVELSLT